MSDFSNLEILEFAFEDLAGRSGSANAPEYKDFNSDEEYREAIEDWRIDTEFLMFEADPEAFSGMSDFVVDRLNKQADYLKRRPNEKLSTFEDSINRVAKGLISNTFGLLGSVSDFAFDTDYKASIDNHLEKVYPTKPSEDSSIGAVVGDAATQGLTLAVGGLAKGAIAGTGAAAKGARAFATAFPFLQVVGLTHEEAQRSYDEVLARTGDKSKASQAYKISAGINGGLGVIPLKTMLRLGKAAKPLAEGSEYLYKNNYARNAIRPVAKQAGAEGFEEAAQELATSAVIDAYSEDTGVVEEAIDNFSLGSIATSFLGGVVGGAGAGAVTSINTDRQFNEKIFQKRKDLVNAAQQTSNSFETFIMASDSDTDIEYNEADLVDADKTIKFLDQLIQNPESEEQRKMYVAEQKRLKNLRQKLGDKFRDRAEKEGRLSEYESYLAEQGVEIESNVGKEAQAEIDSLLTQRDQLQQTKQSLIDNDLASQDVLRQIDAQIQNVEVEINREKDLVSAAKSELAENRVELAENKSLTQEVVQATDEELAKVEELKKNKDLVTAVTELEVAQTKLDQVIAKSEDPESAQELSRQLEFDRAKLGVQKAKDKLDILQQKFEVSNNDIAPLKADIKKQQANLNTKAAKFSAGNIASQQRQAALKENMRDLKLERKQVLADRKLNQKEIAKVDKDAVELADKLQQAADKKNTFTVIKAGDSKIVASKNVSKDAIDYIGNALAAFGLSKPVAILTNKDAGDKGVASLFTEEGTNPGKVKKSKEGEALPSFSKLQNSYAIKVNDGELNPRSSEALAHEVSHVITKDLLDRNPETEPELIEAYNNFISKDSDIDRLASKQVLPLRKKEQGKVNNPKALSFDEWFADNTARYIQNKNATAVGPVQKFFKDIAEVLRTIYTDLTGQSNLKVDRTVEQFLDEHFNQGRASAYLTNRNVNVDPTSPSSTTSDENTTSGESTTSDTVIEPKSSQTKTTTENVIPNTESAQDIEIDEEPEITAKEDTRREKKIFESSQANENQKEKSGSQFKPYYDIFVPESERRSKNKLYENLIVDENADETVRRVILENEDATRPIISGKQTVDSLKALTEKWGIDTMFDIFRNVDSEIQLSPKNRIALGAVLYQAVNSQIKQAKVDNDTTAVNRLRRDADEIYKVGVGLARESGRQVELFKYWRSEPTSKDIVDKVNQYNRDNMKDMGVEPEDLSNQAQEELLNLAEELLNIDERAGTLQMKKQTQMYDVIVKDKGLNNEKFGDTLINYYRANLLANPDTLASNFLYSAFNAAWTLGSVRLATALGAGKLFDIEPNVSTTQMRAFGVKTAIKRAKQALRGELPDKNSLATKYDWTNRQNFSAIEFANLQRIKESKGVLSPAYAKAAVKAGMRKYSDWIQNAMLAGDAVFTYNLQESALRYMEASAMRQADPNITPEELSRQVSEKMWTTQPQTRKLYDEAKQVVTDFYGGPGNVNQLLSTDKGRKEYNNAVENTYLDLLTANRDLSKLQDAQTFAQRITLTNDPVGVPAVLAFSINAAAKMFSGTIGVPVPRFLLPFVNTIANLGGMTADIAGVSFIKAYTGYNTILGKGVYNAKGYSNFAGRRAELSKFDRLAHASSAAVAWGAGVALISMAGEDDENAWFDMTGHISDDSTVIRDVRNRRGLEPYSLKFGDVILNYSETPLVFLLASMSSLRDANRFKQKRDNRSTFDKSLFVAGMAGHALTDATFVGESLKVFSEVFNMVEDHSGTSGFEKLFERIGNAGSSMLPVVGGGPKRLLDDIYGAPITNKPLLRRDEKNEPRSSVDIGFQYGLLYNLGTEKYPYRDYFGDETKKTPFERMAVGVRRFIKPIDKVEEHWQIVRDKGITFPEHKFKYQFLKGALNPAIAEERAMAISEVARGEMTPAEVDYFVKEFGSRMKDYVLTKVKNSTASNEKIQKDFDRKKDRTKLEVQKEVLKNFRTINLID